MDITAFFLPAFLGALLSVATGCSMLIVFDAIGRVIFKSEEVLARAMYFFCGLLMLSWLLLLASMAGLVRMEWVSRVPCLFIVAATLIVIGTRSFQPIWLLIQPFRLSVDGKWDYFIRVVVQIAVFAFFIISLAPPTDMDSLDYHLGVPLEILKNGGLFFGDGEIHFRMFGFGEMLNLPAVAAGCPQLGGLIQFLAFRYMLTVYSEPVGGKTRLDLLVLCMGIPLLLFLVAGQKHMLTGVAATSLAFYALQQKDGLLRAPFNFLFWALLVFAMGLGYSFIVSAIVITLLLVLKDRRWHIVKSLLTGVATCAVFASPLFVYKAIRFGDPLSPMLERFKPSPEPVIVEVQRHLNHFNDADLTFPVNLLIPSSAAAIITIIGLGVVILILFHFQRDFWAEKIAVSLFIILTILTGQHAARYFLEPMFWVAPLFLAGISFSRWQKGLFIAFRLQLLALFPLLMLAVYFIAPALVTDSGRDKLMNTFAFGYSETRWIHSVLPSNANVCCGIRSRALLPRGGFPVEYLAYSAKQDKRAGSLMSTLQQYHVDYYVLPDYYVHALGPLLNIPVIDSQDFDLPVFNPLQFTGSDKYRLYIYKAKP